MPIRVTHHHAYPHLATALTLTGSSSAPAA